MASAGLDLEKTANDWKEEGNNAVKKQLYLVAIQKYSHCINAR